MALLKNIFKSYFTILWLPLLCNLLPLIIIYIGILKRSDAIIDISFDVFFYNCIGTLVSGVVQVFIRQWYFMLLQLFVQIPFFFIVMMYCFFNPHDFYGVGKVIPKGIEIEAPSNTTYKEQFAKHDLLVTSSFQSGIYDYHTDYKPKEKGFFYIKAFEVTSNDRLSESRIAEASKVIVDTLGKAQYDGNFHIYEGDFGDEYGSRIELWYKPVNKKEFKITQRNFIVEGWSR